MHNQNLNNINTLNYKLDKNNIKFFGNLKKKEQPNKVLHNNNKNYKKFINPPIQKKKSKKINNYFKLLNNK